MGIDKNARKAFIISKVKRLILEIDHELEMIDLGCGSGQITKALSKYGSVVGVDQVVTRVKLFFPTLKFLEADIVTDKIGGQYDVVVSSEVIEHLRIQDQRGHIMKIRDLMKENNSFLILTTPNRPVAKQIISDIHILGEHLQPIENWLDRHSLTSLIEPFLEIESMESILPYHRLKYIQKPRLVRKAIFAFSLFLPIYRMFLRDSGNRGLYLVVVARKRRR